MSVLQEFKTAVLRGDESRIERLLSQVKAEGVLPQTLVSEMETLIAMSKWETDSESMAKLRAIVATKI